MNPGAPPIYELHGLRIRSEVPLAARPADAGDDVDLTVRWDAPIAGDSPPAGRVMARLRLGLGGGYTHVATGSGYELDYHGICRMQVSPDHASLCIHPRPAGPVELVPLLVAGNALAFVLTLRGEAVLHASAVELDGAVLAFAGDPGMGKSTLAALLCAAGGRLVADDVLRLATRGRVTCFTGGPELRLRPSAAALVAALGAPGAGRAADGRLVLRPADLPPPRDRLPLTSVVIPRPSRGITALTDRRLPAAEALVTLMRYARVAGLEAPELLRGQFESLGLVARSVPIVAADIPWGPPFQPELVAQLVRAARVPAPPADVAA